MNFLTAIKNIAPMIAGTFGTPLLGMAVSALCSSLPADQAAQVQQAHAADPVHGALNKLGELLQAGTINTAQIKQAELKHTETMAELGFKNTADLAKITADDRDSARKMQIATKSMMPAVLAALVIIGVMAIMLGMAYGLKLDSGLKDTFILGFGVMLGLLKEVYGYVFGSSAGSQAKDATIKSLSN